MKSHVFSPEKQLIFDQISAFLNSRDDILFVYVHGSFVREEKFADIDIGIFLREPARLNPLNLELELETALQSLTQFPVDLRVLNFAPLGFVYNVIKESILVIDKEADLRADFEGKIFKKYLDFAAYRKRYLKEIAHAPL
jgi:predicted nucleotidyltransferase